MSQTRYGLPVDVIKPGLKAVVKKTHKKQSNQYFNVGDNVTFLKYDGDWLVHNQTSSLKGNSQWFLYESMVLEVIEE